MTDEGPSDRPSGQPKQGGSRKFAPTVPSRRKKGDDESKPAVTSKDAAAADEAFKELIKAAQSEAKWERADRGRGRGRGQQRFHVTFGGVEGRPAGGSRPRASGISSSGGSGPTARGASTVRGDGTGTARVKTENDDGSGPVGPLLKCEPKDEKERKEKKQGRDAFLDYTQFYPTVLPIRPADAELSEDEEEGAALHGKGVLGADLAVTPDLREDTAQLLGLLDDTDGAVPLMLFQLPPLMPFTASGPVVAAPPALGHASTPGPPGDKAGLAGPVGPAVGARDLPSGRIGRLLLMESGAVRLQIGDVLLLVEAGVPCAARQEVAVVNSGAGHCVLLGDVAQRAVVSVDVVDLLTRTGPLPDAWPNVAPRQAQQPRFIVQEDQDGADDSGANGRAIDYGAGDRNDGGRAPPGLHGGGMQVEGGQEGGLGVQGQGPGPYDSCEGGKRVPVRIKVEEMDVDR